MPRPRSRPRPARLALSFAAGVALVGGLAACGGGGDDEPEVAAEDAPFCDAYGSLVTGPLADETNDVSDPAVLEAAVATTEELVADLVDSAPAEVEASAAALAAEYEGTFALLERFDFDVARVATEATPEDRAVLDDFGTPSDGEDDPFVELQRFVADRCAPEVTLPPDVLDDGTEGDSGETTTTSP